MGWQNLPRKTKEKDFLQHYVQHYNSIELNAMHYKIYGTEGIAKWAEKAADKDFLFCPKIYQGVTHRGSLTNKACGLQLPKPKFITTNGSLF